MPEDLKKLKTSNYTEPRAANKEITSNIEPIKTGCAVKSPNIRIIEQIEIKMSQINEMLGNLPGGYKSLSSQALEEIDLFQRTTLHELRKEYE